MDGIIFDIDGTIWDSREQVAKAWNEVLENESNLEMRVDAQRLSELFGKPMTEIRDSLFEGLPLEERDRLAKRCFQYENEFLEKEPGRLYPGIREAMAALAEKYPLYIASNCQDGYIQVLLKSTGLGVYIRDFICFDDTGLSKGKNIRILMERNHIEKAVYIGDTQGDADACKEADIPFVFADYGLGQADAADYEISCPMDLLKLF